MELVIHMKRRENHYTCIYIENSQVFYPRKLYTCTYYRYVSVVPGKATGTCSTEAVRVNKSPDQTPATHTTPSINYHVSPGSVQRDSSRSEPGKTDCILYNLLEKKS